MIRLSSLSDTEDVCPQILIININHYNNIYALHKNTDGIYTIQI